MKITLLQIDRFRNHKHSILEPDVFNVIRGSNFAGKSSIAQAISMCLTPSTMGLDNTGRGFATKIQRGSSYAQLTADIQGKAHLVRRTVKLNTNTTGRTDSSICLDDPEWHPSPFEKQLDANRAALMVCLNTDRFFTMDEKDQKSLLAKLALPAQYEFPEETMDAVDKALGEGAIDFDGAPFAVIDKAYKLLYKERENVNRQVKDFVIPEIVATIGMNATTLQNALLEARKRQKKLSAERDAAVVQNGDANTKRTKLEAKIETLEDKIRVEEERIFALSNGRILSDTKVKEFTKVADGQAALTALEADAAKAYAKIERRKEKLSLYTKMASTEANDCPTCGRPTDANFVTDAKTQATSDLALSQKQHTDILDKMKALGDVHGSVKALHDHQEAVKEKADIGVVIGEKTKMLQDATAELNKLPGTTDVLLPFVKPLDEVDAEITAILAKLAPAHAAAERQKEVTTKTEQLKKLQAKAASVDALVKYFDKDGVKATLLTQYIGGFEEKLNVVMAAFGYKVTLAIEPDFEFMVTDKNNVLTPVKELSGSEQLMFAVALQCAVSKSAGIGIVVADRLDTFLPSERRKINQSLYQLAHNGSLEQIFIIVSDDSQELPKQQPMGSAFFFVEAGTVRKL